MISVSRTIPANLGNNNNSPEVQEFAMIDNQGNVDFFIRCGGWGFENDNNGRKNLYQRISFKVYPNIYSGNYNNNIEDFKNAIKNTAIKQIDVAIYNPKKDDLNKNWENIEVFKKDNIKLDHNITCDTIFNAFKKDAKYETCTKNMANFFSSVKAYEAFCKCMQADFGKDLGSIRKKGNCEIEDLKKSEKQEYFNLKNEKNNLQNEQQALKEQTLQLEEKGKELEEKRKELEEKRKELYEKEEKNKQNEQVLGKVKSFLKKGYSVNKGGLLGCCYPSYSSLDDIRQANEQNLQQN